MLPDDMKVFRFNTFDGQAYWEPEVKLEIGHSYQDIFWPDFYCKDSWERELALVL